MRQSHTVGSITHGWLWKTVASEILCGTENPHHPIQKRKNKTLTIPTSQKPSPRPPPPPVPIHTCTSSSASMHGTAYRGGNHLARRLPLPPGCRQSPPHFATSACRRLSPSTFSMLLAVDPAPLGWGICRTEGSFSWTTR